MTLQEFWDLYMEIMPLAVDFVVGLLPYVLAMVAVPFVLGWLFRSIMRLLSRDAWGG